MKIENVNHSSIFSSYTCCVIDYHPTTDTVAQINYVYEKFARKMKLKKSVGMWRVKPTELKII